MSNIKIIPTNISEIRVGDTIMCNGVLTTISKKDISKCSFMGTSLFGDASIKTIQRVLFAVPTNKGIQLR